MAQRTPLGETRPARAPTTRSRGRNSPASVVLSHSVRDGYRGQLLRKEGPSMASISFQELDLLGGEVLPERTLLSTVTDFSGGGGSSGSAGSASSAAAAGGAGGDTVVINDDDGAVSHSSCQSTYNPGTPGLFGSLGLGSNNPNFSMTRPPLRWRPTDRVGATRSAQAGEVGGSPTFPGCVRSATSAAR